MIGVGLGSPSDSRVLTHEPPSPAGGPTHTSIVSYTLHWLPDWGRRLTQNFFKFTIPWRPRGEGPAGVVNQCRLANFRVRLEAPSLV